MAKNVVINGVTYSNVPEVDIPIAGGGTAQFFDTSDASLDSGNQMLSGHTAYAGGTKYTGTIPSKDSTDLTVSGAVVTVPSGYYGTSASKSVAAGAVSTPVTTIAATPTLSINTATGVVTGTVNASQSITPSVTAGYVTSGTAGTVSASGSDTLELPTQSAATYTPGTTPQTIPAGTYLTGAQTIPGDVDLVPANIKAGIDIFGVEGTLSSAVVSQDSTTKVLSIS